MEVANTLAYYDTTTITAVKSFKVQAPGQLLYYYKDSLKPKYNHLFTFALFSLLYLL